MLKSIEVRWFSRQEEKHIITWFSDHGQNFNTSVSRTDFYLRSALKENLGIKLREGNIEFKQRSGRSKKIKLTLNTEGYKENWVKWCINLNNEDDLSKAIVRGKKHEWIEVSKKRMGVKLSTGKNGQFYISNLNEAISFGCQVEYTRLKLNNQNWYTFGLEWFGEKYLKLDSKYYHGILGLTVFKIDNSMGYPEFLKKIF